jgi:hypothetical protein
MMEPANTILPSMSTMTSKVNDFATMHLNVMGYGGDDLRAMFWVDQIQEWQATLAPVMVVQTHKHQEALVTVNYAGKHFFVTGSGGHVIEDDVFIRIEMKDRETMVVNLEKERKEKLEYMERGKAAIIVLDHLEHNHANNENMLGNKDLKVLLMWKGIANILKMRVAEKLVVGGPVEKM